MGFSSQNKTRFQSRQRGFTLIEALVGLLVMSFAMGTLSFVFKSVYDAQHSTNILRSAATLRTALVDSVNSVQGWNRTVAFPDNTSLSCLQQTNARDCTGQGGPIAVMNGAEGVVFNSLRPTTGIDQYGNPCDAFDANPAGGNDDCLLRYDLQWRALCPTSGPCSNPEVEITGTLQYNPANKRFAFNTTRFNFRLVRGLEVNSLYNACVSVHGDFDPITRTCALPMRGYCPDGQFVVGLSSDPGSLNKKICRPFIGACPAGNVITGISSTGMPSCTPTCLVPVVTGTPGPLPADGSTWTDGSWSGGGDGGGDGCDGSGDGCV